MAGPGTDAHKGWRRHVRWAQETTWGVAPLAPEWRAVPIERGVMGLKAAASLFWPATGFGGWKRSLVLPERQETAGQVEVLARPEVTRYLLGAALDRDPDPASPRYCDLESYCVDFYTPPDPRRYLGVVVEGLQIRAEPDAVRLLLRLRAREEIENDALAEEDFDYEGLTAAPFALRRAAVTIAGEAALDVEGFTVTVDNSVRPGPNQGGYVAWLAAGQRSIALELTRLDCADDFTAAIRGGGTLSFQAEFAHPDGHQMTLALAVLHPAESPEDAPPARLARASARLEAAADESGADLDWEVSLAPPITTTTTAP